MGEVIKWLMHDDQKELCEFLFSFVLNILFLALITLLLWPLGMLTLALRWAEGYGLLWIVIGVTAVLTNRMHRFFRMNLYDHANAFIISNLAVSCFLQISWSYFAVQTVHSFVTGVPIWIMGILYFSGVLSCLVTFFVVSSFYQGHIYRLISLPLALVSFLIFSLWPADSRVIYAWCLPENRPVLILPRASQGRGFAVGSGES